MPLGEVETHPYLNSQVLDFENDNLDAYKYLLVGTFPIYPITNSIPVEEEGVGRRANWHRYAYFQYFYGSRENSFWSLYRAAFPGVWAAEIPEDSNAAIERLNLKHFLLTDVYRSATRQKYSAGDEDLVNHQLNLSIAHIIAQARNLEGVLFTSKEAKRQFSAILEVPYNQHLLIEYAYLNSRRITLISLPPPASNRTITDYFPAFPLNTSELTRMDKGMQYAGSYRRRYWKFFLNDYWGAP